MYILFWLTIGTYKPLLEIDVVANNRIEETLDISGEDLEGRGGGIFGRGDMACQNLQE